MPNYDQSPGRFLVFLLKMYGPGPRGSLASPLPRGLVYLAWRALYDPDLQSLRHGKLINREASVEPHYYYLWSWLWIVGVGNRTALASSMHWTHLHTFAQINLHMSRATPLTAGTSYLGPRHSLVGNKIY